MTRVNLLNPSQEIEITPWKVNKKTHKVQFSINPILKDEIKKKYSIQK